MSNRASRRRRRRMLKNHDRGLDRHNKALSYQQKRRRQHQERSALPPRQRSQDEPTADPAP